MKKIFSEPEKLSSILSEHLQNKMHGKEKPLFVFSSDVAANSWSEWAVKNPGESGVEAVALEDFTAWDKFKSEYLAGGVEEKKCVPAILRKFFVRSMIHENLTEHFITKIIPSDDAESAYAFTDWLSKIIPSLYLWHKKYTEVLKTEGLTEGSDPDAENRDYNAVYVRYKNFLDANNFFEPAWLEREFVEKEHTIVIFYPELLEDFSDYEEIFSEAENVCAVVLPENEEKKIYAYRYADSRGELRHIMLRLRHLHESGVPWTDMALSVPDIDLYRPYIKREAERYCVSVNIRGGEPLTQNCAGLIFGELYGCYANNFSYDSLRSLLQNEYVPWKEDVRVVKENLVREGNRLRVLCSYELEEDKTDLVDSWEEALSSVPTDERELNFYRDIKNEVNRICGAKSFSTLHTAWNMFKQKFLDSKNFTSSANMILSRCISELNNLIDVEEAYIEPLGLVVENPFSFFLNELNKKTYRPQEKLNGVSVFPYKLSGEAYFKHQFVIDASQNNLDIPYKKLGFLNAEKRKIFLGKEAEEHVSSSKAFVRLYARENAGVQNEFSDVHFSYAEESFAGFAIAHNALSVKELPDELKAKIESEDFIKAEEKEFLTHNFMRSERTVSENQKKAFLTWAESAKEFSRPDDGKVSELLEDKIRFHLVENRKGQNEKDYVLTQSDMRNFFPCPRKWIFSSVLNLKEDTLDTNLMQNYDMGNLNHKILELYMKYLIAENKCLPVLNENKVFDNEAEVSEKILEFTDSAIHDSHMDFHDSPIVIRSLESQKTLIADVIMNFLHIFCKPQEHPEKPGSKTSIGGFGGCKVVGSEKSFDAVLENGIHIYGKIDCLLVSEDGDFAIVDYKNSSVSVPNKSEIYEDDNMLLGDFQMPLYVLLVKKEAAREEDAVNVEAAYFYAIRNGDKTAAIDNWKGASEKDLNAYGEVKNKEEVFLKRTVEVFKKYSEEFVRRVEAKDFVPVQPLDKFGEFVHVEPYSVCVGCNFKSICRSTFTVGEKEIERKRR